MRRIPEVFGRKNLLLMGVQGFYWCAYCTYFGFLVLYMQNHGYSNVQCAQAQVLIAVATLITQPLIGYLTDSFITCKKFLLVTTALAVPVAFLLQASVSSPILCYGAIVLQSILFYPAASLIDSWTMALREKDSQVQYPLTRSAGSVLYALTALAFGNVIAALGDGIIAPSFLLFSVLLFLCTCFLEETPCRNKQQKNVNQEATRRISGMEAAKTLLQNKTYVFFVLSCLLYHIANKSTGCFISNYVTNIGGDSGGLGLLMFFSAMVEFPSMMVMGKIIRRYPLGGLHLFALSGVVIKNFFFLIASSMPLLVIGRLAEGMSYGAYVYIFVEYICRNTLKQLNVTAISLGTAMTSALGGIIGNYAAGLILDLWGLAPLSLAAMAMAVAAVLVFLPVAFAKPPKEVCAAN
ncbi:MAG: MFS transporter [Oscillospiraceae bacterium]|jgi:PPP family 3-phenylpropionic acid transporter